MIDDRDIQILELLQENGRATASEIARVVQLSIPAIGERIKKLTEKGLIKGYSTVLDHKKAGLDLTAFVFIVSEHSDHYDNFVKKDCQLKIRS
jgi:Transcriptional regulators